MAFGLFFFFFFKVKTYPRFPTLLIIHETPVFPPLCHREGCVCHTLFVALWFTVNSFPSPDSIISSQFIPVSFSKHTQGRQEVPLLLVDLYSSRPSTWPLLETDVATFFFNKLELLFSNSKHVSTCQPFPKQSFWVVSTQCLAYAVEDRFFQTFVLWLFVIQIILA